MKLSVIKKVAILLVALTPACAFLRDRGRDAARMIDFDAGISTGLQGHAGFSGVFELGFGYYNGRRHGLREGAFSSFDEERAEFGVPVFYLHEVSQHTVAGPLVGRTVARPLDAGYERYPLQWFSGQLTDRDPLDFNVSVNLAFVGGSLSIRPFAIIDFALGFVGIDLRHNDLKDLHVADLMGDLHSADALTRRRAVEMIQALTGRRFYSYQSSPKRDVFSSAERAAVIEIESELGSTGRSPSAPRDEALQTAPPPDRTSPFMSETPPASRPGKPSEK